jgi:hypothetical protein
MSTSAQTASPTDAELMVEYVTEVIKYPNKTHADCYNEAWLRISHDMKGAVNGTYDAASSFIRRHRGSL